VNNQPSFGHTSPIRRATLAAIIRKDRVGGFTLVELMIVVAIVAILTAIAYPSYTEHVRKSRRADAQSVMLEAAQFMERFHTENNRYNQDTGGAAVVLPMYLRQAPKDGATKYYDLTLTPAPTQTAYTITATPIKAGDRCGTMRLAHTGVKTASQTDCWRR
jgi:type IV pilus assembly protein PilE